ncbi:hypothetical protein CC80DRAFT_541982 [Byssothecium circinans]|uniref:Diels-Alderase C-terminal domain-containing protein n=1 Tax=Byssothecium circinans TaxID=147558 RepID=A0A6A5UDQ6_9PLEO|nr:hypothetical protein CC80DRAFT_541982 [Byssothecium circinans]
MNFQRLSCLLALVSLSVVGLEDCKANIITSNITNGSVELSINPLNSFTTAALTSLNATAWESWSFTSVSNASNAGATVIFYRDPTLIPPSLYEYLTIYKCDNITTGLWTGDLGNATFEVKGQDVKVQLDMRSILNGEVTGSFNIQSSTPLVSSAIDMSPYLTWGPGILAPNTTSNVTIADRAIQFHDGLGAADHLIAPYNWISIAEKWWWTRSVIGPYTLVYWELVSAIDHQTHTITYLSQDGAMLFHSRTKCADSNTVQTDCVAFQLSYLAGTYGSYDDKSTGYEIQLHGKEKRWSFEVRHELVEYESKDSQFVLSPIALDYEYSRFVDEVYGGEMGCEVRRGVGRSEQNRVRNGSPVL